MSPELTDADLNYLRNINTRPGPNVGQSIDPTKPGPTADRIAELKREIAEGERFIADIELDGFSPAPGFAMTMANLRAELSRLSNPELNSRGEPMDGATIARGRKPTDAENAPLRNEQPRAPVSEKAMQWAESQVDELGLNDPEKRAELLKGCRPFSEFKAEAIRRGHGPPPPAASPGPQDVRVRARTLLNDLYLNTAIDLSVEDAAKAEKIVAAALAQSDARPVAWQYRYRGTEIDPWSDWRDAPASGLKTFAEYPTHYQTRPFYTTPPALPEGAREALEKAVDLFLEARMKNEPGDSRAVADDLVALAAVRAGSNVENSLECLRKCAAEPPRPKPEIAATPTPSSAGPIEAAEAPEFWRDFQRDGIERAAKVIYDLYPYDGAGQKPEWVTGGNSLKQDEARRTARLIVEAYLNRALAANRSAT